MSDENKKRIIPVRAFNACAKDTYLLEKAAEIAAREKRSVAWVMREAVMEYVEKHG